MTVDRIEWHDEFVDDSISEDERYEIAGAHIGYYIEWAYKKGFAPNAEAPELNEQYQKLINSEVNGIQFLIENCDTKFWESDLNEEGQNFTVYAYDTYVENLRSILGHEPYTEKYNKEDYQKVSNYLDKIYEEYLNDLKAENAHTELKKKVLIRDRIRLGNMAILVFLLVVSAASFSVFFDPAEEKNVVMLLLGIIMGACFFLLLPYTTFNRPYMKLEVI